MGVEFMADGDQQQTQRVMPNLVNEAQSGRIKVSMSLEDFVNLDRDCDTFLQAITQIQTLVDRVSKQENWGLGEHTNVDNHELVSGQTVVKRFREKSRGTNDTSDNSVWAIMESHRKAVQDIKDTYTEIRKQITDHDANQAAQYKNLESSLAKQAPVNPSQWKPQ